MFLVKRNGTSVWKVERGFCRPASPILNLRQTPDRESKLLSPQYTQSLSFPSTRHRQSRKTASENSELFAKAAVSAQTVIPVYARDSTGQPAEGIDTVFLQGCQD